ncbi:MAG: TIGR02569 family protein [Pseudomonadota bacterium]
MLSEDARTGPSDAVVAAFGARPPALPLAAGRAWRAGDLVLKRAEDVAGSDAVAAAIAALPPNPAYRVQRPRRAGGEWAREGWSAWCWIEGATCAGREAEKLATARALHADLAGFAAHPPPALLLRRDPWAVADRIAWGEQVHDFDAAFGALLDPLLAACPATAQRPQLVHGDLTGNIVFAQGAPPGVIDATLYWRPAAFAEAVILIDAQWHPLPRSPQALAPLLRAIREPGTMLRRAALRRIAEQPAQVAAFGKDRALALALAWKIAKWTDALLTTLDDP